MLAFGMTVAVQALGRRWIGTGTTRAVQALDGAGIWHD